MDHMIPAVEMIRVSKYFGGVCAVKNVDLQVEKGTIHALLGENGAGKSTLMKMLCGIITTNEGVIRIDGNEAHIHSLIDAQEHGIAMVPQELAFVEFFTVAENIFLGRETTRLGFVSRKENEARAKALLDELHISLEPGARAGDLSVSQQQMLVIAKVLSLDASIIILDEPTARLGAQEIEEFLRYLKYLRSIGKTIILISHKLEEIFAVCDRVTVLRDGEVVGNHLIADITHDDLVKEMVNRDMEMLTINRLSKPQDEEVLQVKELKHLPMVKDVSFSLRRGEILGFYGLVGAGRTEAIRSVLGIDRKDSGEVIYKGQPVNFTSVKQSMDAGIVLVPEERRQQGLVMNLPIWQNTTLTKLDRYMRLGRLDHKAEKKASEELKETLKIACASMNNPVSSLSGGNQQKVVLSKFVDMPVDIFVFDEPTRGIDVGAKSEIYSLIERISGDGASVIIISSEIPELQSVCDRIVIMHEGKSTKVLGPEEFSSAEVMLKYSLEG